MGSTVCAATVIVENRVLPKRFPLRRMLEQILRCCRCPLLLLRFSFSLGTLLRDVVRHRSSTSSGVVRHLAVALPMGLQRSPMPCKCRRRHGDALLFGTGACTAPPPPASSPRTAASIGGWEHPLPRPRFGGRHRHQGIGCVPEWARSAAEDWHRLMLLLLKTLKTVGWIRPVGAVAAAAVSACRGPTSSARWLYTTSSNLQPATSSSRSPPTPHPLLVSATTSRHPGARLGAVLHAMRSWQASLIEPTWRRAGFVKVIGNNNR